MSYQLDLTQALNESVRRIAREQLGKTLDQVGKLDGAKPGAAVHATRKHVKKLRALLRLVCDNLGAEIFKEENRRLRNVGRSLSGARDAQVQLGVLEKLREQAGLTKASLRKTESVLQSQIASVSHDFGAEQIAAEEILLQVGDRVEGWPLENLRPENLGCALHRYYRRARQALRRAKADRTPENFHSWRKRVKDIWYQAQLLEGLEPVVLKSMAEEAKTLGHYLGDLHDFAFFHTHLEAAEIPETERTVLLGLLCAGEAELQEVSLDLGARFFAEKPKAFEKRLLRYAKKIIA